VHELSICAAIAAIVTEHADGRPVDRVRIDVGALRQIVPDTLTYSWEVIVDSSPLAGSVLEVNEIPAVLWCSECGASTEIHVPVFRCPCGSTATEVVSGRELLVMSLELCTA
jgi:hydrogenase nickel incorporation protein HypA/HybF